MYARVARWDGGEAEAIRGSAAGIKARAADGPPEGVPAKGVTILIDPENGKSMSVTFYETLEDLHEGDATLSTMSPPGDGMGTRGPIEVYEVAVDRRL